MERQTCMRLALDITTPPRDHGTTNYIDIHRLGAASKGVEDARLATAFARAASCPSLVRALLQAWATKSNAAYLQHRQRVNGCAKHTESFCPLFLPPAVSPCLSQPCCTMRHRPGLASNVATSIGPVHMPYMLPSPRGPPLQSMQRSPPPLDTYASKAR